MVNRQAGGGRAGVALAGLSLVVVLAVVAWLLGSDAPERLTDPIARVPASESLLPEVGVPGEARPLASTSVLAPAGGPTDDASPAAPAVDADLTSARVSGRVVDEQGVPVADALVRYQPSYRGRELLDLPLHFMLEAPRWDKLPTGSTDADGRFVLDVLDAPASGTPASRPPLLLVEHPFYETTEAKCPAWAGATVDLGAITLLAGVTYVGRVVDEFATPLSGATVVLPRTVGPPGARRSSGWTLARERMQASADAAGRFRLSGIWPGEVWFDFGASGHETVSRRVSASEPGEHDLGDIALPLAQRVVGWVVDGDGRPLADVEVLARPVEMSHAFSAGADSALRDWSMRVSSLGRHEVRVRSDAEGRFIFDSLAAGAHDVIAATREHEPAAARGVDADDSPLHFVLSDPACWLLEVRDAGTGEPLNGATALARRLSDRESAGVHDSMDAVLTVLDGEAAALAAGVDRATPGLLFVRQAGFVGTDVTVSAPGHAPLTQFLPGLQAPALGEQVVVLRSAARLTGRVVDEQGVALAGVRLTAREDGASSSRAKGPQAESANDGRFVLDGLSQGTWKVAASLTGRAPLEPRMVKLEDGQQLDLGKLVLPRAGTIAGVLLDPDGLPRSAAWVVARRAGDEGKAKREVNTDGMGRFRLDDLQAGEWTLRSFPGPEVTVAVVPGVELEVTLSLRRLGRITGRVTDARGPVEGARVSSAEMIIFDESEVVTDARGDYALEHPAGSFSIVARQGDALTPAVEGEVSWDDDQVVDLRFAAGELSGVVLEDGSDTPLAGVRVTARADKAPGGLPWSMTSRRRAETNDAGRFRFARMTPGRWMLSVNDRVHQSYAHEPIDLAPDEQIANLELRLVAGGVIVGRLAGASDLATSGTLAVRALSLTREGWSTDRGVQPDGSFRLPGLAPDRYRIEVRYLTQYPPREHQTHIFAQAEVEVFLGEEVRLDLVAVGP